MIAQEHSPLPWRSDDNGYGHIFDVEGRIVASCSNTNTTNARLIVTAVNAHAKLLAAAQGILSDIVTRDIGSFVFGSPRTKELHAAITAAVGLVDLRNDDDSNPNPSMGADSP